VVQAGAGVILELLLGRQIVPASAVGCGQLGRRQHAAAEPLRGGAQRQLGIEMQLARQVDGREQDIAQLVEA